MTNQADTTATPILTDLAALMTDLAARSSDKHAEAILAGHDTPAGRGSEGQSHAYANAAMFIQDLIDKHTS
jgi:hypothetical protein